MAEWFEVTKHTKTDGDEYVSGDTVDESEDTVCDTEPSDPRSDWKRGFDDGYAQGYEEARAQALIVAVKAVTELDRRGNYRR